MWTTALFFPTSINTLKQCTESTPEYWLKVAAAAVSPMFTFSSIVLPSSFSRATLVDLASSLVSQNSGKCSRHVTMQLRSLKYTIIVFIISREAAI